MKARKKRWSDYFWIVSAIYFTLGFFNIVFAWLGVICFAIPLLMAIFDGGKGYCNNYCGRGQLFLQIGNTLGWSRKKTAPRWLSSKWFRNGFLLFFMFFFIQMIYITVLVARDMRGLSENVHGHSTCLGIGPILSLWNLGRRSLPSVSTESCSPR